MCCCNTMKKANPATSQPNSTRSETQKLYRQVQQIAQRLDRQLQQALDWKEWFDVETLQLRQRVRDLCEHILLSGECDIARKTEEYLWRKAFYDIIQKLKTDKKKLTTNKSLSTVYVGHLETASTFYHQLLVNLRNRFDIPVHGIIDWIGTPQEAETPANVTKEQTEWALKSCQRCLIYLGDIARYQLDISEDPNEATPERYYQVAILLNADNGMPHNQIGTLKQNQGLFAESAYHYMRCILSSTRFEGAEENLKRILEKHNQKISVMQERALQNNSVISMKTQFTASFLSLQEVLFDIHSLTMEELAQWCQSVLSLFAVVLTNNLPGTNGCVTNGYTNGGYYPNDATYKTNGTEEPKHNRIPCSVLFKMLGMNILDVIKLRKNGSELASAATAFAAALLSQLLDYISQYLKQTFVLNHTQNESKDISKDYVKMKKKLLLERRKRRRRNSFNSEHSESDDDQLLSNDDDLSDLSEGEQSDASLDESTDDESGDSVIEERSGDENHADFPDSIDAGPPNRPSPLNGISQKKVSSLSKAGKLLNKQMKKTGHKNSLSATANGVVADEEVEKISEAKKLLDDFEKMNEEAYLPVIKVFFDWLKLNPDVLKMCGKASPVLWQRIADVLNSLPSQKVVKTAVMCFSQRRRLPLWLKGDLDDGTQHSQKRALPEDISLYGTPGFEQLHGALDITWFRGLSNSELYQFALRITYLRNFGHFICESENVPCFTWDVKNQRFHIKPVNDVLNHDDQVFGNRNTPMFTAQRNQMMKNLAKQKLKHDVSQLEQQLQSTKVTSGKTASVYLVLDAAALCRHLSLLRQLVKSGQFVVIVPNQVIAALDDLKKYNPGARDAIKFLEDEIKHGNRWLKTQKEHETVPDQTIINSKKKKNRDIEEWRFLHVVKCCLYFAEKHVGQSLVTLLTSDSSLQGGGKTANMGTRPSPHALEICKAKGIRVEPVVDFYKRWTNRNGPS